MREPARLVPGFTRKTGAIIEGFHGLCARWCNTTRPGFARATTAMTGTEDFAAVFII